MPVPVAPSSLVLSGSTTTQVIPSDAPGESPITVTLTRSAATPVLQVSAGHATTNTAATVYQSAWSISFQSALWGVPWTETQKGLYYFNGSLVWQNSRGLGYDTGGFHRCGYSSGFGFSIDVQSCYKVGGDPTSGSLEFGDQFKVSFIVSGFPVSATHDMAVCAYPSGALPTCAWS